VKLDYTRPGKPTDNGLIESFNGRLRDEFLNVNEFITMHDVREKLKAWQIDYNDCRPHGSLVVRRQPESAETRPKTTSGGDLVMYSLNLLDLHAPRGLAFASC
jgi:putative transposase